MRTYLLTLIGLSLVAASCAVPPPPKPIHKEMIHIDGGSFVMGTEKKHWNPSYKILNPPHKVTLSPFEMAKDLVTVANWKTFLEESKLPFDWYWSDDPERKTTFRDTVPTEDCPAQGLNWYYAAAFCNWLSTREGLSPAYVIQGDVDAYDGAGNLKAGKTEPKVIWNKSANGYRLPTDAEWEYAARGGKLSHGYDYAGSNDPQEVGRYHQKASYPVALMKPNELGLNDMTGDVTVWCWDWFDAKFFEWLPETNPSVDTAQSIHQPDERTTQIVNPLHMKVIRGESWDYSRPSALYFRSHYPPQNIYTTGIRLVRNAK